MTGVDQGNEHVHEEQGRDARVSQDRVVAPDAQASVEVWVVRSMPQLAGIQTSLNREQNICQYASLLLSSGLRNVALEAGRNPNE